MKAIVLFSGGKDSVFAAHIAKMSGFEVELLSIQTYENSTLYHYPNTSWCKLQAKALGLPIKIIKSKQKNEEHELEKTKEAIKKMKADCIITGVIESEYQKQRIDKIAYELGIKNFSFLWKKGERLLKEQAEYLEPYIVSVSAEGLDSKFLMKKFDLKFLSEIKNLRIPINPHLEGGEGETFVIDAPLFSKKIKIKKYKKFFQKTTGRVIIKSASLIKKQKRKMRKK
jgi:ABC transporter with metal-binding/Fe-S-binding domain ATP-binding protein